MDNLVIFKNILLPLLYENHVRIFNTKPLNLQVVLNLNINIDNKVSNYN